MWHDYFPVSGISSGTNYRLCFYDYGYGYYNIAGICTIF